MDEAAIALLGLTLLASVCVSAVWTWHDEQITPPSWRGKCFVRNDATYAYKKETHHVSGVCAAQILPNFRCSWCFSGAKRMQCHVVCRQSHSRAGRRRVFDGCAWQERWLQDDRLGAADHRQQSPLQVSPRRLVSERSRAKNPARWPPVWPVVRPQVGQFARQVHRVDGGWRRR